MNCGRYRLCHCSAAAFDFRSYTCDKVDSQATKWILKRRTMACSPSVRHHRSNNLTSSCHHALMTRPIGRRRFQKTMTTTSASINSDAGPVFRLSRTDRSRLLDAKLNGYLDSSNRSGTMSAAWTEYCQENKRPEIDILCRQRASCEVSLKQPTVWELETQRRFQEECIVEAAQLILGPRGCLSISTGETCDADTLAEALQYIYALRGYQPDECGGDSGEDDDTAVGDDLHKGDNGRSSTSACSSSLCFICPDASIAHAVACSLAAIAHEYCSSSIMDSHGGAAA